MTTTKTASEFDAALTAFVAAAQAIVDAAYITYPFPSPVLTIDRGRRYVRIWRQERRACEKHDDCLACKELAIACAKEQGEEMYVSHSGHLSRSAHCFVDMTNGDILKPDSWKKPAKHARGNIFSGEPASKSVGPHGAAYLR